MTSLEATYAELVDFRQVEVGSCEWQQKSLITSNNFEVVHLIIPERGDIPGYRAMGEVVFHCLEGHIKLRVLENEYEMKTGQLIHLHANELFHIRAYECTSLLVTLMTPRNGVSVESIGTR